MRSRQRHHALVVARSGGPINLRAFLETHGYAIAPGQAHNLFQSLATQPPGDHDGLQRASRSQSFTYSVDTS
jgi:hypothetical protein